MQSQAIIEKIEQKLKTLDPSKRSIFKIFQFNFNKADGTPLKSFVLDLKDLKIYEGTADNADGQITVADDDFYSWASKKLPWEEIKSKVSISGDLDAIKKLMEKFHE